MSVEDTGLRNDAGDMIDRKGKIIMKAGSIAKKNKEGLITKFNTSPSIVSSLMPSSSSSGGDQKVSEAFSVQLAQFLEKLKTVLATESNNMQEFEFNGFDAETILRNIFSRCTTTAQFAQLCDLIMFYIKMGPKACVPKKMARISKSGQGKMAAAKKTFGIEIDEKPDDPEQLTLSRIAAVFPGIIVGLRVQYALTLKPSAGITIEFKSKRIDYSPFCSAEGCYLIKRNNFGGYWAWIEWARKFHVKINEKNVNPPAFNETVCNLKWQSESISDDARNRYQKGFEIYLAKRCKPQEFFDEFDINQEGVTLSTIA